MLNCSIDSSGGGGGGGSWGIGVSYAPRWRSGGFGVAFRPAPARRHFRITASSTRTATRAWAGRETKKASKLIGDSRHMAPGAVGATAPAGAAAPRGHWEPVRHGRTGALIFCRYKPCRKTRSGQWRWSPGSSHWRGRAWGIPTPAGRRWRPPASAAFAARCRPAGARARRAWGRRGARGLGGGGGMGVVVGGVGGYVELPVPRGGRPAAGIGGLDADLQPQALQHLPDIFIEPLPVGPIGQGQYLHRVAGHLHPRLLDQCTRLFQVELEHRRVALVEPGGGRERTCGRFALAEKDVVDDELAVQRMHHRLAHLQVVKRRLALVEHDVGQR